MAMRIGTVTCGIFRALKVGGGGEGGVRVQGRRFSGSSGGNSTGVLHGLRSRPR